MSAQLNGDYLSNAEVDEYSWLPYSEIEQMCKEGQLFFLHKKIGRVNTVNGWDKEGLLDDDELMMVEWDSKERGWLFK